MVDINNDGHLDILSGSYSDGRPMAGLFQVLYGKEGHEFEKATPLMGTDGKALKIPYKKDAVTKGICTRPTAVDWDGDGDLDLVVGNFEGTFFLFTGEGEGKFQPAPTPLMAGEDPLRIETAHSDPFVVDWDGDGDLDILSGAAGGGVFFAENTAGSGQDPELKSFQIMIPGSSDGPDEEPFVTAANLTQPGQDTRVWATDVDSDGVLDLLVGDNVTLTSKVDGLSDEEFEKKSASWKKSQDELMKRWRDENVSEDEKQKLQKEFRKVYDQKKGFLKEERTGFVWFYKGKPKS